MFVCRVVRRLGKRQQIVSNSLARLKGVQTRGGMDRLTNSAAASALFPAAHPTDKIILQGLKCFGYHGVLPEVRVHHSFDNLPWAVKQAVSILRETMAPPVVSLCRALRKGEAIASHDLSQETRNGQHFFVNATLCLDLSPASQSDDVNQTVNYADVYRCPRLQHWKARAILSAGNVTQQPLSPVAEIPKQYCELKNCVSLS